MLQQCTLLAAVPPAFLQNFHPAKSIGRAPKRRPSPPPGPTCHPAKEMSDAPSPPPMLDRTLGALRSAPHLPPSAACDAPASSLRTSHAEYRSTPGLTHCSAPQ